MIQEVIKEKTSRLEFNYRNYNISGLPVSSGQKLIGMITSNDLKKIESVPSSVAS